MLFYSNSRLIILIVNKYKEYYIYGIIENNFISFIIK